MWIFWLFNITVSCLLVLQNQLPYDKISFMMNHDEVNHIENLKSTRVFHRPHMSSRSLITYKTIGAEILPCESTLRIVHDFLTKYIINLVQVKMGKNKKKYRDAPLTLRHQVSLTSTLSSTTSCSLRSSNSSLSSISPKWLCLPRCPSRRKRVLFLAAGWRTKEKSAESAIEGISWKAWFEMDSLDLYLKHT